MRVFIPILFYFAIYSYQNEALDKDIEWTNQERTMDNNFYVFIAHDKEYITFEIQVQTLGFVGFGFSTNAKMDNCDVIFAWVKNDQAFIQDMHFEGKELKMDSSQDYELLNGHENVTHTVIRFRRRLNTCDNNDYIITNDTVDIMFNWNKQDPIDDFVIEFQPLNQSWKSMRMLLLYFNYNTKPIETTSDIFNWDITLPNVTVSNQSNSHWCVLSHSPNYPTKYHIIGYEMMVSPESTDMVHHIALYQCLNPVVKMLEITHHGTVFPCTEGKFPIDQACIPPMTAFAKGMKMHIFPPDIGFPIGERSEGTTHFLTQIHFFNPSHIEGHVDHSGIRVYLTTKLRPKQMSTIFISNDDVVFLSMVLPPNQPSFNTSYYCSPECTKAGFPPEGVYIFGIGFHAHSLSRKMRIRHFRGNDELPYIAVDNNFKYDYQPARYLNTEVQILPGDVIFSECEYSTIGKNITTVGGHFTTDEMCLHLIFYYPRAKLGACGGGPHQSVFLKYFNISNKFPTKYMTARNKNILRDHDWTNATVEDINLLQRIHLSQPQSMMCMGYSNNTLVKITSGQPLQNITNYYSEVNQCPLQ